MNYEEQIKKYLDKTSGIIETSYFSKTTYL